MLPNLWTQERRAYLERAWPDGVAVDEIIRVLNEMDGIKFTKPKQISERARKQHIKRPVWYLHFLNQQAGFQPKGAPRPEKETWRPLWSKERSEAFVPMWQAGDDVFAIMAKLNALEGPPLTRTQQLGDRAKRLKIHRPPRIKEVKEVKEARIVDRKPPRMPLPRKLREPKRPKGSPIKVPYHTLYNQGFQLWYGEAYGREVGDLLPRDKRNDLEAINRAIRKAEPGHPGFEIATRYWGR
jgi:hypothetical protein